MKTKINIYCYELTHKTNPALKYNFYTLASNIDNRFNNCSAYGFIVNNAQGYSERLTFDDIINMRYLSCALYENYLYYDSKNGGQSWTLFREMGSVELKPEYCLSGEIKLYAYTNKILKGSVLRDCLWYSPNTDDIEEMKSNVRSASLITWFGARLADDDNTDWANNWWYGGVELNDERIANDLMDYRKVKTTFACGATRIDTLQRVPEKDITISNISGEPDWVPTPLAHNSIFEVSKAIAHQIGIEKDGSNKYEVAYNILEKLYGDVTRVPELDFTLGDTQIDPSKLAYSFDNLYGVTLNILDLIKNNEIHPEPKPNKLTFDGSTWSFERTPDIDTYVLGDLYVNSNKVGTYQGFTTKNSISDWEEAALDIISDSFGNQALTIIKENEEWRTK